MSFNLFHQSFWAQSAGQLPIELYAKGHNSNRLMLQNPLLFIGGVHGDEPEGVRLAEEFLQWLKTQNPESLKDWILIPCLNVDGYLHNSRTNAHGVDLNRNFPSQDWIKNYEKTRYFPGEAPGSEPEVQALVQLIHETQPALIVHFHSWEPCIVYTGAPAQAPAQLLQEGNSYEVREDIGYPTPGSLGNFGWQDLKIPVICIEEQEKIDLNLVWPHFSSGLKKLVSR